MRRDDECFGQQQEACTLAMLQRHLNAEQEGSLAVSSDVEGTLATKNSKAPVETSSEAEGRHSPAVSKAAKKAEEKEDLLKPNSTEGGDHAYNSSESSADNSSDSDLPEAPAAGNITEPAELANATFANVSKPEPIQAANPPEPITVTLVPDTGPPMQPEEMPSSPAEQTPPLAEEVLPLSDEEEVLPLPATGDMPDEAMAEAAEEAEAVAEAEEEAWAQAEDEAEAEAEARAVAESEAVPVPETEDLGAAQRDAERYGEESMDLRESEDFGA